MNNRKIKKNVGRDAGADNGAWNEHKCICR